MGKTSKWFRDLLGWKKSDQRRETTAAKPSKDKRSWSFVKSYREKDRCNEYSYGVSAKHRDQSTTTARKDIAVRSIESVERVDQDKHAIAVAAAAAAVAEAAVAAAHAAAAVVRLTNSGRCGNGPGNASGSIQIREVMAAVKIQAAFRGCLARRALRALRGLVRLQALVRGHIERKRTSEWLLRMQAILRAQTRARAGRAQISEFSQTSSKLSSQFHPPGPATPEKFERDARLSSLKFDQSSMTKPNRKTLLLEQAQSFDHQSTTPLKFLIEGEEGSFFTPGNSPQLQKRSPYTPTKSTGSSYLSGYSDYPNYMAFTEASKAKIRSLSAPRQRPQYERSHSTKRSPGQSNGDHSTSQKGSLQANFTNKAYPGSGRLDRLGMPVMPVGHRY